MRDAYWTKKRRFKICRICVVHFAYFRADALGIFQLVPCVSFRMSAIYNVLYAVNQRSFRWCDYSALAWMGSSERWQCRLVHLVLWYPESGSYYTILYISLFQITMQLQFMFCTVLCSIAAYLYTGMNCSQPGEAYQHEAMLVPSLDQ